MLSVALALVELLLLLAAVYCLRRKNGAGVGGS